ncbi:MAG: hypothetical protein LBT37_02950 [Lactobacillaceae bacterium]|nr:hypothetical protein [Lactobacillaceae bacterium]
MYKILKSTIAAIFIITPLFSSVGAVKADTTKTVIVPFECHNIPDPGFRDYFIAKDTKTITSNMKKIIFDVTVKAENVDFSIMSGSIPPFQCNAGFEHATKNYTYIVKSNYDSGYEENFWSYCFSSKYNSPISNHVTLEYDLDDVRKSFDINGTKPVFMFVRNGHIDYDVVKNNFTCKITTVSK